MSQDAITKVSPDDITLSFPTMKDIQSSVAHLSERFSPTSFGRIMGLLYKVWTLDCVPTIAHAISLDFSDRPELYQDVALDIATKLVYLQGSYGFQAYFPDTAMRQRLMKPIFGQSDGRATGSDNSEFHAYRMPVVVAAAGFSENAQEITFPQHRERVRNTIVPFKTHMADLKGASLDHTGARVLFNFYMSEEILKAPEISAVFGINAKIEAEWPLGPTDAHGAKLIEKITTQLSDLPYGVISREMFVHMQRIAEKGFQSISKILDDETEDPKYDIDPLVTELYAWGSDLRLVGGAYPQQTESTQTQRRNLPTQSKGPMATPPRAIGP